MIAFKYSDRIYSQKEHDSSYHNLNRCEVDIGSPILPPPPSLSGSPSQGLAMMATEVLRVQAVVLMVIFKVMEISSSIDTSLSSVVRSGR